MELFRWNVFGKGNTFWGIPVFTLLRKILSGFSSQMESAVALESHSSVVELRH